MDFSIREEWLAAHDEEVIEPERAIVDPHHHFFVETDLFPHYRLADLWADTATHRVERTVFAQCGECYRKDGPEALRPVGETEWIDGIAREAEARPDATQIAGIVATADLRLGAGVREVLEAHRVASPLFRGIRQAVCWDDSGVVQNAEGARDAHSYREPAFREGFAVLAEMGLSYDAYHYHPQNADLADLARAFPQATIVLDHLGTPLGVGPYEGKRDQVFAEWKQSMNELASCPNVHVKLGGLAMPWNGFGFEAGARPPSSDQLLALQGRYYEHAIERFGAERCMFESNFPVDKLSLSYEVLWNFFKKLAAGCSEDEKEALFRGTATRVYRL